MNNADAERQIEQMIAFIAQEAKEKAEEISVKTEKEFMAEKLTLETQSSLQIRADHERAKKDYYVQKKIERSKLLSEARFATMRRRDDKINELKANVLRKLAESSQDARYAELVRFLIAQGLQTLLETHVTIQCRKEDLSLVQKELPAAIKMFQENLEKATGVKPSANVTIDTETFLAPGPKAGDSAASCAGGVLLSARKGQIICRNTLDHRLDLAFEQLKPTIRGMLFGVREKFETKEVKRQAVSMPR